MIPGKPLPTLAEHPTYVFASAIDSDGIHNCPSCGRLVTWGLSIKGKRARFDYPADLEGRFANHHITCPKSPGKARTRDVLAPSDAPGGCVACRESILHGGLFCKEHWSAFRAWMESLKPDANTIWRLGNKEDRRVLLKGWVASLQRERKE